jgi:predicted AAA+ superfamily ATPase
MENAVYSHLVRNNYQVFVGQIGNKEIDFVAEKNNKRIYGYPYGNNYFVSH